MANLPLKSVIKSFQMRNWKEEKPSSDASVDEALGNVAIVWYVMCADNRAERSIFRRGSTLP